MASGTPVVSTSEGGHGEFLRHEENALIFKKERADDLASRMLDIIRLDTLRKRLAAAGRREVETNFTMRRYVDDLEAFLGAAQEKCS
jgi:glycosyltransferase involved in cell wall biosynthesis